MTKVVVKRKRVQVHFDEPSLTKQSFRDDADVNALMAKYSYSQLALHNSQFQGNYGDFTNVQDYQSSLNEVIKAQDMFMTLPSKIRTRFGNDPAEFLAFVSNDYNREEMVSLGLIDKKLDIPAQQENIKNAVEDSSADCST